MSERERSGPRRLTPGSEEELRFQIMQKGLGGKFNLHLGILLANLDDLRALSRPAPAEGGTVGLDGDTRRECPTCNGRGELELTDPTPAAASALVLAEVADQYDAHISACREQTCEVCDFHGARMDEALAAYRASASGAK